MSRLHVRSLIVELPGTSSHCLHPYGTVWQVSPNRITARSPPFTSLRQPHMLLSIQGLLGCNSVIIRRFCYRLGRGILKLIPFSHWCSPFRDPDNFGVGFGIGFAFRTSELRFRFNSWCITEETAKVIITVTMANRVHVPIAADIPNSSAIF